MALNELNFTLQTTSPRQLSTDLAHYGVVGSGDIEILLEHKALNGKVTVQVVTPINGFDHVWELVLNRFIQSSGLSDVHMSINDNNATPAVVALRLQQALLEIEEGDNHE